MFDVAIVGAGPAGSAAAIALRRLRPSFRIALLEAARHPRRKLCGGAVPASAAGVLATLGLGFDDLGDALCCTAIELRCGPVRRVLPAAGGIRIYDRSSLDSRLARIAADSGARLFEERRVVSISGGPGAFAVVDSGGRRLEARVVIGADGAAGICRAAAGIPVRPLSRLVQRSTPAAELLDRIVLEISPRNGAFGYEWAFPSPDGNLEIGAYLRRGRLGAPESRAWTFRELDARRLSAAGILLAGDAAGGDPLLAEGIRPAWEMGVLAATHVAERLDAGDPSLAGFEARFAASSLAAELAGRRRLADLAERLPAAALRLAVLAAPILLPAVRWIAAARP